MRNSSFKNSFPRRVVNSRMPTGPARSDLRFIVDLRLDDVTARKFRGHYVILEGTCHAPTGPYADYLNGFLERISKLRTWGAGDLH